MISRRDSPSRETERLGPGEEGPETGGTSSSPIGRTTLADPGRFRGLVMGEWPARENAALLSMREKEKGPTPCREDGLEPNLLAVQ